jgi:sulfite exporter TauE/SafE
MALFGAGTLPAMLLFAYSGQIIKPGLRNLFRRSVPYFISAMGAILILRGLQLGIPILSPQLPGIPGQVISCGH